MSNQKKVLLTLAQQRILDVLEGGVCTWDELQSKMKIDNEKLGLRIGELLNLRKIWTGYRGEVRVYGIERRTGLGPRPFGVYRRESDLQA